MKTTILSPLVVLLACALVAQPLLLWFPDAASANSLIEIEHEPPECIPAQQAYPISAKVRASVEFDTVRVYFKVHTASFYYFTRLRAAADSTFTGLLPPASREDVVVEYVIAAYRQGAELNRSRTFFTITEPAAACPSGNVPAAAEPLVVYVEEPNREEVGFRGDMIAWKRLEPETAAPAASEQAAGRSSGQATLDADAAPAADGSRTSLPGLPPLGTKVLIGIGLGAGLATAGVLALLPEEETIDWTLDPDDKNKRIKVEIIKTPTEQTTCGTIVSNALYVTNDLSEEFTVTSIDYEVVLTRDKPSGACAPGRVGTFAPNWAVNVAPGERALVRQWSNAVNPCSGCPYTEATCRWNSKYVVHTPLGSGDAETEFRSEGDLCAATSAKFSKACLPPAPDVEP